MSKRRRQDIDTDEEDTCTTLNRSDKLWFEDGNIVIRAGSTQFKVHRGVLSRHSPIFSDLFQVPHPLDQPTVDGCPVIQLYDKSDDVESLLLALYGDEKYIDTDQVLQIDVVAAMIRLGRKYEIPHLKYEGMRRLKRQYPISQEDYADLDKTAPYYLAFSEETLRHENLFAENILFHGEDLSIPYDALRKCVYGREKLLYAWVNRSLCTLPSNDCGKTRCRHSASKAILTLLRGPPPDLAAIVYPWQDLVDSWTEVDNALKELCTHCREALKKAHEKETESLWEKLPGFFKLPGWDDLKDLET